MKRKNGKYNDYEIDRVKARHPDAVTWLGRVGYDAVFAIGGTLVMVSNNP
jgi:hypothetical protein